MDLRRHSVFTGTGSVPPPRTIKIEELVEHELSGDPAFATAGNGDGGVPDEETPKMNVEPGGEGGIAPHKVDHPALGNI